MAGAHLEMLNKIKQGYPNCPLTNACGRTKCPLRAHFAADARL